MREAEILKYLGDLPDNDVHLPMLVRQMQTPVGVVPLVGAGMSAPFGYPQWTAFLLDLAKRATLTTAIKKRLRAGQYEEAAEDLITALHPTRFQDLVAHHYGDHVPGERPLGGAIGLLPKLSSGPVITTNFDGLLKKIFHAAGSPFEDVVWHSKIGLAIPAFAENRRVLLKIHGDWQDAENRVLTLSEYKENYGDPDAAIDFELPLPQLFKLLATHPALFLGCSLNQDRTVAILKRIAGTLPTTRHYAVVEKPASTAKYQKRADYMAAQNIRPIWYLEGKHDRIEGLLRYLAEQAPAAEPRAAGQPGMKTPRAARQPDGIPRPLTTFIGREQEREQLKRQLRNGRLLTITGAPGAGKTRVAMELARSVRPEFERVWFVELSQLPEKEYVAQRVATVLGIREQAPRPPTEVLADFLGSAKHLLVFDNCEHVIEACTALADYLLRHCPELRILTTSRQHLNVNGEQLYVMPALELPDPERHYELAELAEVDSVELLLERARARSDFKLTEQNAAAVATLCHGLEGMPLAIELAASQLATMTVEQIVERLNQRLEFLTGGAGGTVERQWATLDEAIRLSYDLLEGAEKVLFRRLSLFRQGWVLEAAAAVCSEEKQGDPDILRLLNRLYRVSLLVIEDRNGQKRFRMLDSIREFAGRELAEANEEAAIAERHARWFVQLAEKAAPEFLKKDLAVWLDALSAEADNLRAAVLWAIETRQAEVALRLVGSLWRLTEIRGYYREGMARLQAVLAMPETAAYPALRSRALSGLGILAYRQGDITTAEKWFQESLEIERSANNLPGIANALNDLGNVAKSMGEFEQAQDLYESSLDIEREIGNPRGVAVALFNLGDTARRLGRTDRAAVLLDASWRSFEAEGNLREAAFPLNALGWLNLSIDNFDAATEHAERSLKIRRELVDKKGVSDTARTLATIRMKRGDLAGAHELLTESAELARGVDDKRGIAETLEGFAALAAIKKEYALTVAQDAAAEKLRHEMRIPLAPVERAYRDEYLEAARAALSAAEFSEYWEKGRRWSISEALSEPDRLGPLIASAASPVSSGN